MQMPGIAFIFYILCGGLVAVPMSRKRLCCGGLVGDGHSDRVLLCWGAGRQQSGWGQPGGQLRVFPRKWIWQLQVFGCR